MRKGTGSPVIDEIVKKDSLLVYLLNVFGILLVGVVVSGKVRKIAFEVWVRPRVATFFRFNKTLSMTGRKLFSVLTMAATVYERENVRRYSQSSDTLSLLFDFF